MRNEELFRSKVASANNGEECSVALVAIEFESAVFIFLEQLAEDPGDNPGDIRAGSLLLLFLLLLLLPHFRLPLDM
jgi:hypothetical protein